MNGALRRFAFAHKVLRALLANTMGAGVVAGALIAGAAHAQTVTVLDGDTLRIDGRAIRIHGIDAPEKAQWCGPYPAGALATAAMEKLTSGGNKVECEPKTTDRFGRLVAICRVDGFDLGKAMVVLGMAWAFIRYSNDYVNDEAQARANNFGVHRHGCTPAWDWRAEKRRSAPQ